jgi:hypothetical protein
MKKVIDSLKEIITKDSSTQTDPVSIINNEEDMKVISIGEKRFSDSSIKKIERELESFKNGEMMSGADQVEPIIELAKKVEAMYEEGAPKPDASFYDKCKAYLDSFDHNKLNYYSIKQMINQEVTTNLLSLEQCTSSVFSTNIEESNTKEQKEDSLKAIIASMYLVYTDMKLDLDQQYYNNFQELLYVNMTDIFGSEISGDVISFLEKYGE